MLCIHEVDPFAETVFAIITTEPPAESPLCPSSPWDTRPRPAIDDFREMTREVGILYSHSTRLLSTVYCLVFYTFMKKLDVSLWKDNTSFRLADGVAFLKFLERRHSKESILYAMRIYDKKILFEMEVADRNEWIYRLSEELTGGDRWKSIAMLQMKLGIPRRILRNTLRKMYLALVLDICPE